MRVVLPGPRWGLLLLCGLLAGCASPVPWGTDLSAGMTEAHRTGKPLLVISIVGDLRARC